MDGQKLLFGADHKSWVQHSPNLMFARRSVRFQEQEYCKAHLDFTDGVVKYDYKKHKYTSTVEPRKIKEMVRLYEWMVLMFGEDIFGRVWSNKDAQRCMDSLTTQIGIGKEDIVEEQDDLTDIMNKIMGMGERKDDKNVDVFDGNETDNDTDADIDNDDQKQQQQQEEEYDDNTITNEYNERSADINPLGVVDVFTKGKEKMTEINISEVRFCQKQMAKRTEQFMMDIYSELTNARYTIDDKISRLKISLPLVRTFRSRYRYSLNHKSKEIDYDI